MGLSHKRETTKHERETQKQTEKGGPGKKKKVPENGEKKKGQHLRHGWGKGDKRLRK